MYGDRPAFSIFRELYWALKRRLYISKKNEREVIDRFHTLFFDSQHFAKGWATSRWLGAPLLKSPLDLWIYQEILYETKPDVIIETGTFQGGSALYFASICELLGRGRVISVDIEDRPGRPVHPRITYLQGSSTDSAVIQKIKGLISPQERAMVVLDSDHTCAHVSNELQLYGGLVTRDCYLVVEDTNINGHPAWPDYGPGPYEAVEAFLGQTKLFQRDLERERFMVTFHPGGFLRRIA